MERIKEPRGSKLLAVAGIIIIAGALHVARDIFIPLAVAILLSFFLAPLVQRLTRLGLPNVAAVLATVAVAFSILGVVAWLVSAQFMNLVSDLPKYQENLQNKIVAIKQPRDSIFSRAAKTLGVLKAEIERDVDEEKGSEPALGQAPQPIPVQIAQPPPTAFQRLNQYAGPLLGPLGTAAISFILVVFILLQRNDVRDRFIKLVSGGNLNLATQAVDDATQRISRYLVMHVIINVSYGLPVGIGLYFIGVPSPILWGLLATLLRFIPYVGPWIAAVFPISLAFAVDPGWTMPLLTIGLIVAMELFSNNVIEPWLYGTSTGISAVALVFAAVVWTWIWGPVGLFLATPLTVCLLVVGKNVPSLSFLNVILGTERVLAPEAQIYQRMLAMDAESMLELAENSLKADSLTNFYDRVLVPALILAESDRHAGVLAEHRQQFIIQSARDLIEELGERYAKEAEVLRTDISVLCVAAKDEADELTALMFGQLLRQAGFRSESVPLCHSTAEIMQHGKEIGARVVSICAIPPGAIAAVGKKCRLLRAAVLDAKLIAGIWGTQESATALEKRLATHCPNLIATTFADALVQITNAVAQPITTPMLPAPIPAEEPERLKELTKLGLLDTPPEELYDTITRKLAETFNVPLSLVTLVDADRQFWKSQIGLPEELATARQAPRSSSLCGHVVAQNELLVIEDLAADTRFANNPWVKDRGIRFYAGAPLRTKTGHVVGSLCVIDTKPRKITEEQKWLLTLLAKQIMENAEQAATQPSDRTETEQKELGRGASAEPVGFRSPHSSAGSNAM